MSADDITFQIRADHTIELSTGRLIEPIGVLRNIHEKLERMPIIAVERIGSRLSVTTERSFRGTLVWLTQAFPLLSEDNGRWPGFSATTFPGTVASIAGDDQQLFRLPDGIATFPYLTGFGVEQVDERYFVVSCSPRPVLAGPIGDNVWAYDRAGHLLWRVGHNPSLKQGMEYKYDYGVAFVRGELWALSDKAPGAKIDLRTGAVLEVGTPPRD